MNLSQSIFGSGLNMNCQVDWIRWDNFITFHWYMRLVLDPVKSTHSGCSGSKWQLVLLFLPNYQYIIQISLITILSYIDQEIWCLWTNAVLLVSAFHAQKHCWESYSYMQLALIAMSFGKVLKNSFAFFKLHKVSRSSFMYFLVPCMFQFMGCI